MLITKQRKLKKNGTNYLTYNNNLIKGDNMIITKHTKAKDLPKGNYILTCGNYVDPQRYFLINGKIAKFELFNTKAAFQRDKINISQLKRDRDQLFAEATLRLKTGEKLYITDAAIEREALRIQETRNMKHPWLDIISTYLEGYSIKKTTVRDLFMDALDGDKSRMTYTNKSVILNILMLLGWERNSSGEYVNPKIQEEIEDLIKEL